MTRRAHGRPWLALLALVALVAPTAGGRAELEPLLDVTALSGGTNLRAATYVLRDPSTKATLQDVIGADAAGRMTRAETDTSFGFTHDAVWVRFDAYNPSDEPVDWLLELAYPHDDEVDLYVLHDGQPGEHRAVGDHLPFAVREIDHANFLFEQTTPPHTTDRFYLRVRSEGAVRAPLWAWTLRGFMAHAARVGVLLWMFYGAMLVMVWYNLCVAGVIRSREHIYLAMLLATLVATVATLSGHVFQYLLPAHPELANRALVTFAACVMMSIQLYGNEVLRGLVPVPRVLRLHRYALIFCLLLVLIAALSPPTYGQRIVLLGVLAYVPMGFVMLRTAQREGGKQLRWSVISFYALLTSLPIALLAHADVIPPHPLALWAVHIGCAAYCVLASLALPVRLKTVSARLVNLNGQLSSNVEDLTVALGKAERATEDARRATAVKDEFMATMSHELRTPLNAIINVPQGLLEDFPSTRAATCAACGSQFVLEPEERLDHETACPDCHERGVLRADTITRYTGKPAHTARFLAKIERSGRHLLQMVNGVLDFSKMEAGRLTLSLGPIDLVELLHETTEELSDVAQARGIDIVLHLADDPERGTGDAVRLRQVLLNLLSNAIKFSQPNGVIDVRWQRDPDNDVISVTDRGIGIAQEDHSRVFYSFEQVHKGDTRKYGGTGLGLSISRSLIRMHGGELWVESRLGEGATFTFRIPRANVGKSDDAEEQDPPRPSPPDPP